MARIAYDSVVYNAFSVTDPRPALGFDYYGGLEKAFEQWLLWPTENIPADPHLLGYWGFDEANETDLALDETEYAQHLIVSNSPAATPGRVGNGRQFNGTTTVASPNVSTPFLLLSSLTIITWAKVTELNSGGSNQRCILSCEGAGSGSANNALFRITVDKDGRLIYMHMLGVQDEMTWSSAPGVFKAGRFVSVNLVRRDVGGECLVELYLDGTLVPWASAVYSATPEVDYRSIPAPLPDGGSLAILRVGRSGLLADNAPWYGAIDETSIHDIERAFSPYLRGEFYRVALSPSLNRLTVLNNIQSVGSAEMGSGVRWWTYERDQSLYVIREQPLGLFQPEVQLTTGYNQNPGGTSKPKLAYDSDSDTLLVIFVANSKIYKITANSADAPATLNVPTVQDTAGIVKLEPVLDPLRLGMGGTNKPSANQTTKVSYTGGPGNFSIGFYPEPFSILMPLLTNVIGHDVYRRIGGQEVFLGRVLTTTTIPGISGSYYSFPITSRTYGSVYLSRPVLRTGVPCTWARSSFIIDYLGLPGDYWTTVPGALVANRDKEAADIIGLGSGAPAGFPWYHRIVTISRTPLKMQASDPDPVQLGSGCPVGFPWFHRIVTISRTPIKMNHIDPDPVPLGMGGGGFTAIRPRSGGQRIP